VFFGYTFYSPYIEKNNRVSPIYRLIPDPLRAGTKSLLSLLAPTRFDSVHRWLRGPYSFLGGNIGLSDVQKHRCLAERVLRNGSVLEWSDLFSIHLQREQPNARLAHLSKQLMLNEFNIRLPDLLLTRVDRVTMANSVEVRNPYLDRELVEYATAIPFDDLFDGRLGKVALRRALEGLLPEKILKRGKVGFGGSLEGRRKPLVEAFHREIMAESGFLSDYFDPTYLSWLVTDQAKNTYEGIYASWNVVLFALWKRKLGELMRTRLQTPLDRGGA
jgi:asparagine synthase (glutamine-hydrolysing)